MINGKKYKDTDEQLIKETGLQDESELVLFIEFKPITIRVNVFYTYKNDS